MIDFDPYVPATWLDDALVAIRAIPIEGKKLAPRSARKFKVVAAASVFAVGMALTNLSFYVPGTAVGDRLQLTEPITPIAARPDDVAPGYWPKLIKLVRETPLLTADDAGDDPTPLV